MLAFAGLAASVGSCGQQTLDRDTAIESFRAANLDATEAQAACVIDRLIDRYGLDELQIQLATSPQASAFAERQVRDAFVCGANGDVRAQITEQLDGTGVDDHDAPCVADELVDGLTDADVNVLLTGEITPEFNDKFYAALEACGAL